MTRQTLYRELAELRRELNIPIVLVTHDFDEAARLAGRMCLLDQGRMLQAGTPREVLAHPVSVEAARLVDLKNMFEATIEEHRPREGVTIIRWGHRRLAAAHRPDLRLDCLVAWAIPSTEVVLHRADLPSPASLTNLVVGTVGELVKLSESTAVVVLVEERPVQRMSITVPEHYARRTGLAIGATVTVSLLKEGIHLMPLNGHRRSISI